MVSMGEIKKNNLLNRLLLSITRNAVKVLRFFLLNTASFILKTELLVLSMVEKLTCIYR